MSINLDDHKFDNKLVKLYTAKHYDECIKDCKETLSDNPLHLQALLYMASISLEKDDLEDCVHYCDTIIQGIGDQFFYVWSWRGQALCTLKRYKESEDGFEQAIMYDPENTETWSHLAMTFYIQGKKDIAMVLLEKVEEKLECYGKFAMVKGFIERHDGNTDEALMHFLQGGMSADPTAKDYDENKKAFAKQVRETLDQNR